MDINRISGPGERGKKVKPMSMQQRAAEEEKKWIKWEAVGKNGRIALWHRPRKSEIHRFAEEGATCIVTLQGERERPEEIGNLVRRCKTPMKWLWVPLEGANRAFLGRRDVQKRVREAVLQAAELVNNGESLIVHCAAGVHRTGVFAYSLFRLAGCPKLSPDIVSEETEGPLEGGGGGTDDDGAGDDPHQQLPVSGCSSEVEVSRPMDREEATAAVMRCRLATGRGVGTHRLDVAEEFVVCPRPRPRPRGVPSSSRLVHSKKKE